jgi:NhaP-type Na+/H+ or K+/H+ antiporter
MTAAHLVALVLAVIGPLLALARVSGIPATLLLFGSGIALAFVPGMPPVRLDPDLMLGLLLPPIIYAATVRASVHLLRFTVLPGVVLGALLALATMGGVAWAARLLLPGLPWTSALLIGTVVAVFDTRLFHEAQERPAVPRAISDTLKVREMVSRVVILSTFALVQDTATDGPPSAAMVLGRYTLDLVGGAALGVVIGRAILWLRERIEPAPVEIAVSLATPYAGALAAEALGISTVVVVMTAALVVSAARVDRDTGASRSSSEARLAGTTFWEEASLILSSVLFLLIGRSLPEAMRALDDWPVWWLIGCAAALLAVILAAQHAFSLLATVLPPVAGVVREHRGPGRHLAVAWVMMWGSTRSAIGLLLALSIPAALPDGRPFPDRDLILVIGALVVLGSILVQGLTLRLMVQTVALGEEAEEHGEERLARRRMHEVRTSDEGPEGLAAERQALEALREEDRIGDEVQRRLLRETDLRERVGEGSALPGAGPPNP